MKTEGEILASDTVVAKNVLVKGSIWEDSNPNLPKVLIANEEESFNAFKAIQSAFKSALLHSSLTTKVACSGGINGLQINCSEDEKKSRRKCICSLHIVAKRVRIDLITQCHSILSLSQLSNNV